MEIKIEADRTEIRIYRLRAVSVVVHKRHQTLEELTPLGVG